MLVWKFSVSQKTVFNGEQYKRRELIMLNSPYKLKTSEVNTGLTVPEKKKAVDIFSLVGYFRWETGTEQ